MKKLISILALGALTGGLAHAQDDSDSIEQVITRYETALNASDATGVLELYGKSPTFMPQHAPAQIGRDAVKEAYDNVFSSLKLSISFTIHEVEVLGETAWARTSSAGKSTILANNLVVTEGNNELFIFRKEQGEWKIHQYLFATNQPRQ